MKLDIPSHYPVTCHTDRVGPGSTFVAVQGASCHGGTFISEAIAQGATKIVVDATYTGSLPQGVVVERVEDAHAALARLAAQALGNPADALTVIGVTGTKGKTSTCYILSDILRKNGVKVALLGTVENRIGDVVERSTMTTPTADFLQMFCAAAVRAGMTHLVIEISAHALSYKKITNLLLDGVIFTNFSHDHLDFYGDLDRYFAAKATIFDYLKPDAWVIANADDAWGDAVVEHARAQGVQRISCVGISEKKLETDHFTAITQGLSTLTVQTAEASYTTSALVGTFNAYNLMMAVTAARMLGITSVDIQRVLNDFTGVPGRLYTIALPNDRSIIIDYAHNHVSTEAVLALLRPLTQQLIVVFGCGGNRDATRRPLMGKAASLYADVLIITSDNPRFEDPHAIIADICAGVEARSNLAMHVIVDRACAIQHGIKLLADGGILAILGKGHEQTQIIAGEAYPFDDVEVAQRLSSLA